MHQRPFFLCIICFGGFYFSSKPTHLVGAGNFPQLLNTRQMCGRQNPALLFIKQHKIAAQEKFSKTAVNKNLSFVGFVCVSEKVRLLSPLRRSYMMMMMMMGTKIVESEASLRAERFSHYFMDS